MKTINLMVFMALVATASAQTTPLIGSGPTELQPGEFALEAHPQAANELKLADITLRGIVVQLFKAPHLLQVVNPLAPKSYGNGEQNVVRDPMTDKVVGLKVLSIDF